MIGIWDQARMQPNDSRRPSMSGRPRSTMARSGLCVPAVDRPSPTGRRLDEAISPPRRIRRAEEPADFRLVLDDEEKW